MKHLLSVLLAAALLVSCFSATVLADTEPDSVDAASAVTTAATSIYNDGGYPNTWVNTGNMAEDIAGVARSQIGYTEISGNHTKYNLWYYKTDSTVSWCGVFIAWCADQAGVPTTIMAKTALAGPFSTSNMQSNPFRCPAYSFSSTTAHVGDVIFVDNNSDSYSDHVGLVVDVDDTYIYTAEGNVSDSVGLRQYLVSTGRGVNTGGSRILFYARPNYLGSDIPVNRYPSKEPEPCSHDYSYAVTEAPGCETYGTAEYTCTHCGDSYTETVLPTGHCYSEGYSGSYYCIVCQRPVSRSSGHTYTARYSAATCTEQAQALYTCSDCGDSFTEYYGDPISGHNWSSWTISTPCTADSYGVRSRTCQTCKETFSETIPYLNPFTDLATDYYYIPALWARERQIVNGMTDTTFGAEYYCTRAQIVTLLWRAAGKPEHTITDCPFEDVDSNDPTCYYYDAMLWAYENRILRGTSDTTFSPGMTCTRAQIVTFLYRYAGEPETQADGSNPFTDVNSDDPNCYYASAVQWAVENSITNGIDKFSFGPTLDCKRGQVVTFLYRDIGEDD